MHLVLLHIAHFADVNAGLDALYKHYLLAWGVKVATIGIAAGALTWMVASRAHHPGLAAGGLGTAIICVLGLILLEGAPAIAGIGQAIGKVVHG